MLDLNCPNNVRKMLEKWVNMSVYALNKDMFYVQKVGEPVKLKRVCKQDNMSAVVWYICSANEEVL